MSQEELPKSFWDKIEVSDCWVWKGTLDVSGYGQTRAFGKLGYVHRELYSYLVGPVPSELVMDHLCRNPPCCNPDHLEPVTQKINARRGQAGVNNRIKTECPSGHPYSGPNLRIDPYGRRKCRKCQSAHAIKSAERSRANGSS